MPHARPRRSSVRCVDVDEIRSRTPRMSETMERKCRGRSRNSGRMRDSVPVRPGGVRTALALVGLCLFGCASPTFDGLRAARLYASGSDALENGEPVRAVTDLEEAARLVPHASEIQNHLGLAYWANGDLDRARSAFDRALELDCDNAAAQGNRLRIATLTQAAEGAVDSLEYAPPPPGRATISVPSQATQPVPSRAAEREKNER